MLSNLKISNKIYILMDQAIVSGSALLTQAIIAGTLGMAVYGRFSALVLIQLFLLSVQQSAVTGMYAVVYPAMKDENRHSYISGLWTLEAITMVTLAVLTYVLHHFYSFGLTNMEVFAAIVNAVMFLLMDFFRRLLLTNNLVRKAFVIDIINNALQLGVLIGFIATKNLGFLSTIWICGLTFIPSIILSIVWLNPTTSFRLVIPVFYYHGKEALWMTGSSLVQWFSGNFYIVTAGVWLGPTILGVLRLSQYAFGVINVLLQAIENYLLPKAAAISSDPHRTIDYLRVIQKKMLLWLGAVLGLIAVAAKPVLHLLKANQCNDVLTVIYGMCAVYILVVTTYPIRIALRSLKLSRSFFTGYAINSIFSFSTAYLFVHQWGISGVVLGLFLSQLVLFIFWVIVLQNKFKFL